MKIEVMNHSNAEEYSLKYNDITSVIISITNCGDSKAFIIPNNASKVKDVLHLQFNDTDKIDDYSGAMEEKDAELIADFISKHISNNKLMVDKLIVHCTAGQSRSAGVAAAILKVYTGDDSQIFNNKKYTPNMLCYRLVLNKLVEREVIP